MTRQDQISQQPYTVRRRKMITPGPWNVYRQPVDDKEVAKQELIALVDGTPNFRPVLFMIAAPNGLAPAVTGCGADSESNAHLIAAAPELYEALEKMANAHHAGADELRSFARAALKKARGEP